MPACIIAEIIWYFILKTRKEWIYGTIVVIAFIVGIVLYQRGILNIFMINRVFCVLLYMFMGYLFRQYEERINNHQMTVLTIICVVIYVALGIVTLHFYPGQSLDVHLNYYYSYPICFAMILSGLISIAVIAKRIEAFPNWILLVGQNTLVIYLFHSFGVTMVERMFRIIHLPINALTKVLITVIVCAVCTTLAIAINRFIPGLLGKKPVKQK